MSRDAFYSLFSSQAYRAVKHTTPMGILHFFLCPITVIDRHNTHLSMIRIHMSVFCKMINFSDHFFHLNMHVIIVQKILYFGPLLMCLRYSTLSV